MTNTNTAKADAEDATFMKRHRSMILSMALLAAVTLLGFLGLLGAILYKISGMGKSAEGTVNAEIGVIFSLPEGADILHVTANNENVEVRFTHPGLMHGSQMLILFDPENGKEKARYTLRPEPEPKPAE